LASLEFTGFGSRRIGLIVATPVVDSRKRLELRQELRVGSEGSWT